MTDRTDRIVTIVTAPWRVTCLGAFAPVDQWVPNPEIGITQEILDRYITAATEFNSVCRLLSELKGGA